MSLGLSEGTFYILILVVTVLIADIVILVFTAFGFSDACRAFKISNNWQYTNQNNQSYNQAYTDLLH